MVYIQGGPIGLTFFIIMVLAIGFGLCYSWFWFRSRPHRQMVHAAQRVTGLIAETKRVLEADAQHVSYFVHEFSREIGVAFAGADWLHHLTLDDMRKHAECAVFDLIQGCRCGQCTGVSNGGAFWIEATYAVEGIKLTGYVAQALTSVSVTCAPPGPGGQKHEPLKTSVPPYQNVEMKCACGKPVMTSLDHIGEGKKPVCAACIAGGSRA
jgi:hypothetical protein